MEKTNKHKRKPQGKKYQSAYRGAREWGVEQNTLRRNRVAHYLTPFPHFRSLLSTYLARENSKSTGGATIAYRS